MLHEGKKTKAKTNEKVKSESLMLSSRETNKLKSSSHQQEYSRQCCKKKQRKLLGNCMHHTLSNQQNMLPHTMEHKQSSFPVSIEMQVLF